LYPNKTVLYHWDGTKLTPNEIQDCQAKKEEEKNKKEEKFSAPRYLKTEDFKHY
jgi:hypothetical protein